MAFETLRRTATGAEAQGVAIDLGLRSYMLRVYNYMGSGLALTGIVALLVASNEALMQALFGSGLMWVVMLAPLALVFFLSFRVQKMSLTAVQTTFWLYAGLMGAALAPVFVVYTGASIARTFFICAATFAGMSLYGYTTKKDLSGIGSFLIMGLWGLILASLVNLFMQSSMLQFVISAAGVLIFTGLTAWDTQKIKELYLESDHHEIAGKKAVMGALTLYMDFLNLFLMLLRFFGDRR
ncbi:MAG: Bax inhibitor-1/YccA family protein [Alphaproteobacteria bacterium]|nr:Bax inhibitor-1/YccA family protein [Alphaproteobacteria bacterium]